MTPQQTNRWKAYGMEAIGLGGFVAIAGLLAIFLEYPDMPVMKTFLKDYPTLRRIPLGILLGAYVSIVTLLISKRSGAHINPAVTWTFYRLGNIQFKDGVMYTVAQLAGAVFAAFLLKLTVNKWFSHPSIHYGITKPLEPHNSVGAFIAEFIISFITMWVILVAGSSKKTEKKLPLLMGILIAGYLIIELPFSGMSMNPARSFAGAAAGNKWGHLWIYFVAPLCAMLLASEIFLVWKRKKITIHIIAPNSKNDDLQTIKSYPVV